MRVLNVQKLGMVHIVEEYTLQDQPWIGVEDTLLLFKQSSPPLHNKNPLP